jgi:hypothetical protein
VDLPGWTTTRDWIVRIQRSALLLAAVAACANGGEDQFYFDDAGDAGAAGDGASGKDSAAGYDSGFTPVESGAGGDAAGGDAEGGVVTQYDAGQTEASSGGGFDSGGGSSSSSGSSGGSTCNATTCSNGCCQGNACRTPLASSFQACATAVAGAACQDCSTQSGATECFCASNLCVCL